MTNAPFTGPNSVRDIESINHQAAATTAGVSPEETLNALRAGSRDNARTPMQWTAAPEAGFSTAARSTCST